MKKVLYVILAIAVVYLICCLIGPSNIKVERSATINASPDAIKSMIADYNVFSKWSPWAEKDTAMKVTVEGTPGTVGHKYAWEGNKQVGKGTMEITSISTDSMTEKLDFSGKGVSNVAFVFKPEGAATNVTWAMDMPIGFFGRGMMMFMKGKMDQMLGGDFEKGLAKLKTVSEAAPKSEAANYNVMEMGWAERTYAASKTENLTMEKMAPFFATNFPKLMTDIQKDKVTPQSAPSSLCFKWDMASMSGDMAAAIGIANGTKVKGWETITVPACKVLFIAYYGPYTKIGDAHNAMMNYMKEKNLTNGLVVEEYVTDPGMEKDSTKWQTNIYYTLK